MDIDTELPPVCLSSSPPPSEFELSDCERLDSSIWNKETDDKNILKEEKFTRTQADFEFSSSDPITAMDFCVGKNFSNQPDLSGKSRKRGLSPESNTQTIKQDTKFLKLAKFSNEEEKILANGKIRAARDLLMQACGLVKDTESQTRLLDLIEIFREYTEKGNFDRHTRIFDKDAPTGAKTMDFHDRPTPKIDNPTPSRDNPQSALPRSYAKAAASAPFTSPASPRDTTKIQKTSGTTLKPVTTPTENTRLAQNPDKILTIVLNKGCQLPKYNPITIRDTINKLVNKKAIARVHTSPRQNIVLTCMDSDTEELLIKIEIWIKAFDGWPVQGAQRVNNWPKLVVHGVPAAINMEEFKTEVEDYNNIVNIQGNPRWLAGPPKKQHGSVVFSVQNEEVKSKLKKTGILVGALLLKVVNYQDSSKSQCRRCLKYGHATTLCKRQERCAICAEAHLTADHLCTECKASGPCSHIPVKCANCKASTHTAFDRKQCDFYQALL